MKLKIIIGDKQNIKILPSHLVVNKVKINTYVSRSVFGEWVKNGFGVLLWVLLGIGLIGQPNLPES
jgi:hypothetical protein